MFETKRIVILDRSYMMSKLKADINGFEYIHNLSPSKISDHSLSAAIHIAVEDTLNELCNWAPNTPYRWLQEMREIAWFDPNWAHTWKTTKKSTNHKFLTLSREIDQSVFSEFEYALYESVKEHITNPWDVWMVQSNVTGLYLLYNGDYRLIYGLKAPEPVSSRIGTKKNPPTKLATMDFIKCYGSIKPKKSTPYKEFTTEEINRFIKYGSDPKNYKLMGLYKTLESRVLLGLRKQSNPILSMRDITSDTIRDLWDSHFCMCVFQLTSDEYCDIQKLKFWYDRQFATIFSTYLNRGIL